MVNGVPTALEWLLAMGAGDFYATTDTPLGSLSATARPVKTTWHLGRTENISQTGVFFRGNCPMEADSQVEISLEVFLGAGGDTLVEIICQGEIVRMVLPATLDAPPGLAARIFCYRACKRRR